MKLRSNKLDAMTFNSIADLKSFPSSRFSDGAVANVLGYYAPGDGGGGEFVLNLASVAADNGGTVIAPDSGSGRWERVWSGAINVKWFGAVGDTVHTLSFLAGSNSPASTVEPTGTNDTAAFLAAVNLANSLGGGEVFVPATNGWYKIYAGVLSNRSDWVELDEGTSLIGENGCKIYIWPREAEIDPAVGSQGITLLGNNRVSNITFDGGAQDSVVDVGGEEFVLFRTINVYQSYGQDKVVYVDSCRFFNACGSHITGLGGAIVEDCFFGDYLDHCVYFGNAGSQGESTMNVSDCYIYAAKTATVRDALKTWGAVRCTITGVTAYIPNGTFATISGRENVSPADSVITGVSYEGDGELVRVGCENATESLNRIVISDSTVKCDGHPIVFGAINGSLNAKDVIISDLVIESALPILLSSGRSDTLPPFSAFDERVIENVKISNVKLKLTSGTYRNSMVLIQGTIKNLIADNVEFSTTLAAAGGGIFYYRYPSAFTPEQSSWTIRNSSIDETVLNYIFVDTVTSGYTVESFPIDISIENCKAVTLNQLVLINGFASGYDIDAFDDTTVFIDEFTAPSVDVSIDLPKGLDGSYLNETTKLVANNGILEPYFEARPVYVGEQRFQFRQNSTNGFRDLFIAMEDDIMIRGDSATAFNITNTSGARYRYTWASAGTNPRFAADTLRGLVGGYCVINGVNFNAANNGTFRVVAIGTNYIEVYNEAGVAEANVTIGNGGYFVLGFKTARASGTIDERARITGCSTSQYDITNPAGDTYRYSWDGTGTDPKLSPVYESVFIGQRVDVQGQNFNAANNGVFFITGVGPNYFEVENASGVAENNVTIGTGSITVSPWKKLT